MEARLSPDELGRASLMLDGAEVAEQGGGEGSREHVPDVRALADALRDHYGVAEDARLERGQQIKRIVGGELPDS